MADNGIHIYRGALELGVLSEAEARELLVAGFLLPSDCFRRTRSEEARPLSEFENEPPSLSALAKLKHTTEGLRRRAVGAAEKITSATGRRRAALGAVAGRLLEDFLPRVRASVQAALAKSARSIDSILRDEPFLRKLFGAAYDSLPKPVRRFVNEESFIVFCLKHRAKLLGKDN